MDRLTDSHTHRITYNGERDLECSNYCDSCGHADCDTIREMLYKLKSYENAEENGLLVRLSCKVGTVVFKIFENIAWDDDYAENWEEFDILEKPFEYSDIDEIGKTVFLTQEEAEAKLKEMEGENANSD